MQVASSHVRFAEQAVTASFGRTLTSEQTEKGRILRVRALSDVGAPTQWPHIARSGRYRSEPDSMLQAC